MKLIANVIRILVGIEFVFSGFVKVVDPYGTGLKLQEYFEVFAADAPALSGIFEILANNAQPLSLLFCAAELILGVALLTSFRMKATAWIVLGLMTFFTFLTFYSAYYNKVTDCGCFGDFLKLKPWNSFLKDIISLALILVIFAFKDRYKPMKFNGIVVGISTVIAFGIGLYGLNFLPAIDFLTYAEGLSIPEQMKPTGVKPDIEYTFTDKTNGVEVTSKEFLMDTARYKYLDSKILNQELLSPKITDYSVGDSEGNDVTLETFDGNKLLIIVKKLEGMSDSQLSALKALDQNFYKKGTDTQSMLLTSLASSQFDEFKKSQGFVTPTYAIDEKVLKTMARTNPCVILLKNGVVQKKWGKANLPTPNDVKAAL